MTASESLQILDWPNSSFVENLNELFGQSNTFQRCPGSVPGNNDSVYFIKFHFFIKPVAVRFGTTNLENNIHISWHSIQDFT